MQTAVPQRFGGISGKLLTFFGVEYLHHLEDSAVSTGRARNARRKSYQGKFFPVGQDAIERFETEKKRGEGAGNEGRS